MRQVRYRLAIRVRPASDHLTLQLAVQLRCQLCGGLSTEGERFGTFTTVRVEQVARSGEAAGRQFGPVP